MPPWLGGPSFWRENVIEPAPESIYAEYSGMTMPGAKPGGIDTFRIGTYDLEKGDTGFYELAAKKDTCLPSA